MVNDGLDCDIKNILECRENEEFEVLQRLSAYCHDIYTRTAASLAECERRQETITENMAKLHRVLKDSVTEKEKILLEQKVTDKKIAMAIDQKAKLEEEIKDALRKKENISLELVELTRAFEESRKQRKERWNAIKMACTYYKENLDIHISVDECEDHDKVKLTFFQMKNPDRDNYYVILENRKSDWTVGQIVPALKETHMENIKAKVDFTKSLRTLDVIVFLCALRNVFSKYYLEE